MLGMAEGNWVIVEVSVTLAVGVVVGRPAGTSPQPAKVTARHMNTYPGFFIKWFIFEDIIIVYFLLNLQMVV
jgi:hypothetical protein